MTSVSHILKREHRISAVARAASVWTVPLLLALALTGCAGFPSDRTATTAAISIERFDSPSARIETVQFRDDHGRLEVSGRLQKRHAGRSPIPGHLHIAALGWDGALLAQTTTRYRRLNPKQGSSEFRQDLAVRPEQVRMVRVIHHARKDQQVDCGACRAQGTQPARIGSMRAA